MMFVDCGGEGCQQLVRTQVRYGSGVFRVHTEHLLVLRNETLFLDRAALSVHDEIGSDTGDGPHVGSKNLRALIITHHA
jgi:hypothetical protein